MYTDLVAGKPVTQSVATYTGQLGATSSAAQGTKFAELLSSMQTAETDASQADLGSTMMMCMMMGGMNGMLTAVLMNRMMQSDGSLMDIASLFSSGGSGSGTGAQVLELAKSRLGDPYSQAKAGQDDYTDCSYLTRWCYRQTGVELPRTAAEQARYCVNNGMTISKDELQPGDLVFFSSKENGRFMDVTHVAVYAGNGKIVDASSSRGEVVYRDLFGGQVLYGRPS